jgi:hypothetical protein
MGPEGRKRRKWIAAIYRRAGGDTVQQNILPTVLADAPVLDHLARNLVPPLAAAGQRRVSPIRRADLAFMPSWPLSAPRAAPEISRWSLRVDVGEGIGVGIERSGVEQAAGQRVSAARGLRVALSGAPRTVCRGQPGDGFLAYIARQWISAVVQARVLS